MQNLVAYSSQTTLSTQRSFTLRAHATAASWNNYYIPVQYKLTISHTHAPTYLKRYNCTRCITSKPVALYQRKINVQSKAKIRYTRLPFSFFLLHTLKHTQSRANAYCTCVSHTIIRNHTDKKKRKMITEVPYATKHFANDRLYLVPER